MKPLQSRCYYYLIALCLGVLTIRLVSLGSYQLMDTSEARYGEMARIMAETGNWLMPMFDYQVPFWGKPPLFSWLSAAGIKWLGVSELAVRLPHFFIALLTLGLVALTVTRYRLLARQNNGQLAWLAATILATSPAFIMLSGAVLTDMALLLSISCAMLGAWLCLRSRRKRFGYLLFFGLGLGMLAKGPLAVVLVGSSLALWATLCGHWGKLFNCLPWRGGLALFTAMWLPWYLLAEIYYPGFLNYFIVGEHFKRFLVTGWQGDLYGTAHRQPRGTIWLYWLACSLPWLPLLLWQFWLRISGKLKLTASSRSLERLLLCWTLTPLALFSFSGNILWTYVLPCCVPQALLVALYWRHANHSPRALFAGLTTAILLAIYLPMLALGLTSKNAQQALIQAWKAQPESAGGTELYYLGKRPFSAQFYSSGKAKLWRKPSADQQQQDWFIASREALPADLSQCHERESQTAFPRGYRLWFCPSSK